MYAELVKTATYMVITLTFADDNTKVNILFFLQPAPSS